MNPTPDAITHIKAAVATIQGGWTNDDASLAAALNAPSIAQAGAAPQIPGSFGAIDVGGLISAASLAKVLARPSFSAVIRPMLDLPDPKDAGTLQRLNEWAAMLFKAGDITQTEFDALAAPYQGTTAGVATGLFNKTVADPGWQAQISWAQANLGRPADAGDIAAARRS